MARKPRIHVPGGLYHVMLRGNGGQAIFSDDADRRRFCDLVADGVERFGHRIHAYCLMPNHVHLAIRVGQMPASRVVQNLAFRYARVFNRRVGRDGHLFQGRFRSILVDGNSYLLELVRYIHLNPVRAGLVPDPSAWAWSGHRTYLGKDRTVWLDSALVLAMFDDHDVRRARRRYAGFVREGLGEPHREEMHFGEGDTRVLGDPAFVQGALGVSREPRRRIGGAMQRGRAQPSGCWRPRWVRRRSAGSRGISAATSPPSVARWGGWRWTPGGIRVWRGDSRKCAEISRAKTQQRKPDPGVARGDSV